MSSPLALLLGLCVGFILCFLWVFLGYIRQLKAEHQLAMQQQQQQYEIQMKDNAKRSVNTSRAVLKGKMAEQFAPILPEFPYLPSDAKFLGDPIDYVVFSGYSEFREGLVDANAIEVIFIDIKSGQARLSKGQQAIAQAISDGRVRFETIRINIED